MWNYDTKGCTIKFVSSGLFTISLTILLVLWGQYSVTCDRICDYSRPKVPKRNQCKNWGCKNILRDKHWFHITSRISNFPSNYLQSRLLFWHPVSDRNVFFSTPQPAPSYLWFSWRRPCAPLTSLVSTRVTGGAGVLISWLLVYSADVILLFYYGELLCAVVVCSGCH